MVVSPTAELIVISRAIFVEMSQAPVDGHITSNRQFHSSKDIVRSIFQRPPSQRYEKELSIAIEYLNSVKFFSRFTLEVRKKLCKVMNFINATSSTILFEEGEIGRHFYIIFSGQVDVSVKYKNRFDETAGNVVATLGEGDSFGELALSESDGVRRATVQSTEYGEFLTLNREQFEPLVKKIQSEYREKYVSLLRQNLLFQGAEWDDGILQSLCSVMNEKSFPLGSEICKQGSRAMEVIVIVRGECEMIQERIDPISRKAQAFRVGRFGPNSILSSAETCTGKFTDIILRDYAIVASTLVKVLLLSRFNLFQMLSMDTLATIRQHSLKIITESVESRALKTVLWDRYRHDVVRQTVGARVPDSSLTRCSSAPLLPSGINGPRHIVDADFVGFSDLHPKKSSMLCESDCNLYLVPSRGSQVPVRTNTRHSMSFGAQQIASLPVQSRRKGFKAGMLSQITKMKNNRRSHRFIEEEPSADGTKEPLSSTKISFAEKILSEQEKFDRTKLLGYADKTRSSKLDALQSALQSRVFSPVFAEDGLRRPSHGIHHPFSLIGFLRDPSVSLKGSHITGFRILGKCRAFGDAIHLFRTVCIFETESHPHKDTSQFAIYKDDELTMVLINHFDGRKCAEKADRSSATIKLAPHYRPRASSCGNEQRFACARVFCNTIAKTQQSITAIEPVTMHVYQSFSSCQSAVRFAKANADVFIDAVPLVIIPLFEWVLFSDLQQLNASSADLDQAIEIVTTRNILEESGDESLQSSIHISTCKGRRGMPLYLYLEAGIEKE
uniref:Uncharacterized protein AlNc14C25G2466 n=1 Tax=Albugo laibachii Nc14 TaxID=890382 RepID=F0W6G6_9STRA|nr:conserved hypothetical protein [Albugo laibachii Nc14]|eukprot:CCA16711.1 conserved hypothetical protein [Albugo laibachii Nc14]